MNQATENVMPLNLASAAARPAAGFRTDGLALVILLALPVIALRHAILAMTIPGETMLAAHVIAESLYVAAALSIFGVTWLAPSGGARLRPTLVGCLSLAAGLLALLHLLTYPGLLATGSPDDSFLLARLAHLTLPFALATLLLVPRSRSLSQYLRWGLLTGMLACVLPAGWAVLGLAQGALVPDLEAATAGGLNTAVQWLLTGFDVFVCVVALVTSDGKPTDRRIVTAAVLGAVSEALLISAPSDVTPLAILSHVCAVVAESAMFLGVYAEAVGQPYRELEQSRTEALMRKESLGAVIHSVAEGVVVVDGQLRLIAMNPIARNLAGTLGNPDGMPLGEALAAIETGGEASIVAAARDCLASGEARTAEQWSSTDARTGTACVIEHSISPICSRNGDVQGAVLVLRDITERWRHQLQLFEAAEYARNLIEASVDAMMVVNMDGRIADVNHAAEQVTGLTRRHLIGRTFSECFADTEGAARAFERVFPEGIVRDLPLTLAGGDGETREVSCNMTPYRDRDGRICGVFAVARDVTDMRLVQKQLQFQARHDALTGLPNRRQFRERLEHALAHGRRQGRMVAVFLLDLDDFKDINDTLGHSSGDQLIKGIGGRLAQCLRATDMVARIGGDEFAILAEDIAHAAEIHPIATKLLEVVTAPVSLTVCDVTVSCSIGVSIFPLDPGDADTLLRNADTALYRAKEAGKNNFRSFTAEMNDAVQRRVDLGNRLRGALGRSEFTLVYQPQADLVTGRCSGVEALLRWTPEGLGPVSPTDFIPIAENSGLIQPIGIWVLEQACRQAAAWRNSLGIDVSMAINLSARQFRDDDIVATVARVLAETGLPAHLVVLELTESMLMRDAEGAAETMARLKETGVRIAIDDFGTGYSSLSYLKRFPLDYLKIDRSFVMDIPGDANDKAIIRSIVALAHSLGLKVIGEGVETAEQMAFLRDLGCSEAQGYHISRPVPAAEAAGFLTQVAAGDTAAAVVEC